MEIELAKKNFIIEFAGSKDVIINALPVDCSFRKYYRITFSRKNYLLMDCPPQKESIETFINITKLLQNLKISTPKLYNVDLNLGFAIIEDFGDGLYQKILSSDNSIQEMLYKYAIDLLVYLQEQDLDKSGFEIHNEKKLLEELSIFVEWYYPTLFGESMPKILEDKFYKVWANLFKKLNYIDRCLVLRDYHAENLFWLSERRGLAKVGVIDYQDALIGSYAYDLVSLLEDARIDVDSDFRTNMIRYYQQNSMPTDNKQFLSDYMILGAQRNCRIMGVFARKALRDNQKKYLKFLPRVWGYVNESINNPVLSPLREWFIESKIPNIK